MTDQQLTPIQYADQALAFVDTKAQLAKLAESSSRILAITSKAGYQECHAARMALKSARVNIEKRGKDARADAVAIQKTIIAKEKELIGLIEPEELRLKELQDAVDQEEARAKAAKELAEREAAEAIRVRFDVVRQSPLRAVNATVEQIDALIAEVGATDTTGLSEIHFAAINHDIAVARSALRAAREQRAVQDAEAEKVAAQLAELAELRARDAERQAELDRLAAAERERVAEEARRVEQAERQQREAIEAAQRKAREEEQARIDAERAEQRRKEDAEREEAAKALADQQAANRREAERLAAEKAENERRATEQAIASATLYSAASEAVGLLTKLGHGEHIVTKKLAAAVAREPVSQAA